MNTANHHQANYNNTSSPIDQTNNHLPILDTLAHPTLTGNWLNQSKYHQQATFEQLIQQLEQANYMGACAIGMFDIEQYTHQSFIQQCHRYPQLIPIAGFNPLKSQNIVQELHLIADLGFVGIKIHPRFSNISLSQFDLSPTLALASQLNLVLFYCTYQHSILSKYPSSDPFFTLVRLLQQVPDAKVVLVHGGDVQLMRYAELVRFNPNLLLDLSLTILKYQGSSIDLDIRFLFEQFDRRICIGTDFPEYSPAQLRQRFIYFSKGIALHKLENIAFKNLTQFLGWKG